MCVTPAVNETRIVDVAVSLNSQKWSVGSAVFGYIDPIELLWLEPRSIVSGRKQSIRIGARGLRGWKGSFFCKFAGFGSAPGIVLSDNVAQCTFYLPSFSGNISLSISVNAVDWSSSVSLNVLSSYSIQLLSAATMFHNTSGFLEVALPSESLSYSCFIGSRLMDALVQNRILKCQHGLITSTRELFEVFVDDTLVIKEFVAVVPIHRISRLGFSFYHAGSRVLVLGSDFNPTAICVVRNQEVPSIFHQFIRRSVWH